MGFIILTVGSNPRKRGRESPNTIINHPFSIQLNPPQFMDLTHLQTPQPNAVSTGLRLAFGEQSQQRKHQQLQQQQQQQNLSPQSSVLWSLLSEDLATQIRQQREEIEQFLQAQVSISLFQKWGFLIFPCLGTKINRNHQQFLVNKNKTCSLSCL